MKEETLTWKDIVADALRELGGQGHLSDINEIIKKNPKVKTNPTWRDTIRRVVRQYKIFEPVPPERSGVYKLVELEIPQPLPQTLDSIDAEINHDVAQGMLVTLGNIYGYETFAPKHDQTIRRFDGKSVGDLVTVKDFAEVFQSRNLSKIREIDVLWFAEDDDGLYPVYAFEVEHTTRVKSGLDRLLKIPARLLTSLFIVAPTEDEQKLYEQYVNQTPFRNYRNRFTFRLYSQLQDVYNAALSHDTARESFGVIERGRKL